MGVTNKTKKNTKFSSNIKKGDFIAADWASDGKWDHMGFVTGKKNKKNGGYYPYKVAQHSNDYNLWTTSKKNNWEKDGDGRTYARVRR